MFHCFELDLFLLFSERIGVLHHIFPRASGSLGIARDLHSVFCEQFGFLPKPI